MPTEKRDILPPLLYKVLATITEILPAHGIAATADQCKDIAARICGGRSWVKLQNSLRTGHAKIQRPGNQPGLRAIRDILGVRVSAAKEVSYEVGMLLDDHRATLEQIDNLIASDPTAQDVAVDQLGLGERDVKILRNLDIGTLGEFAARADQLDPTTLRRMLCAFRVNRHRSPD